MRTARWIAVTALTVGLLALPGIAHANGGAYFGGMKTYYVGGDPNDPLVATYHAHLPGKRAAILERGPFYVYLMRTSALIREGKPIPREAILVDTLDITPEGKDTYRISTSFAVPALPTGDYKIEVCNSPCTIAGFREAIGGYFTIVATPTEAQLLKEQAELEGQLWASKRALRKMTGRVEDVTADLESMMDSRSTALTQLTELREQVASLEAAAAAPAPRPLIDPWVGGALALALGLVAAALFRKRGPRGDARDETEPAAPTGNGHGAVHELTDDPKVPARR